MSRLQATLLWTATVVLSLTYASGAFFKFSDLHHFARYGYPPWFCLAIGVLEAIGAVGLWIPSLSPYLAFLLAAEMVGAVVTHLRIGERAAALFPFTLFFILIAVGVVRYRESRRVGGIAGSIESPRTLRA